MVLSGRNLNSIKILCMSSFKFKKYLINSNEEKTETTQGKHTCSQWSDLAEIRTHPSFNAMVPIT